ncbi:MAG: methyltransferase domain-containing protein [Mollicutes bacterium]|nr:methyltransferase domain-containing protein [Mollicutes bacterium]
MIIYNYYKTGNSKNKCHSIVEDDGPKPKRTYTGTDEAWGSGKDFNHLVKKAYNIDLHGKKILDVGMGTGNILYSVKKDLDANVYGVDICNYLMGINSIPGKTFPGMDVRKVPKEWYNTFDMAYQILFSVPYKDTLSVMETIAKCLKPNGVYLVTFDDPEYIHSEAFVLKIIKELYKQYKVQNNGRRVIAYQPIEKPQLTPMEEYYYQLSNEQFKEYITLKQDKKESYLLSLKKSKKTT